LTDEIKITTIDAETAVICLELVPSQVVILQGVFELMEGTGIVRTLDAEKALVCIITTPCMMDECLAVLRSLDIQWRSVDLPADVTFLK